MSELILMRNFIHYGLHFLFPVLIAYFFFREKWKHIAILLVATILIDLDHLLVDDIFDPNRCSINFHLLHSYTAIIIYGFFLFFRKTRIVALGLLMHMATDFQDCLWM